MSETRYGVMTTNGKVRRFGTRPQAAIYQFENGSLLLCRCILITPWHVCGCPERKVEPPSGPELN